VTAWSEGWPKKAQPSLQELLSLLHPQRGQSDYERLRTLLNKLVHSDPAGSVYNMIKGQQGVPVFASGKVVNNPKLCDAVAAAGWCYLNMLSSTASAIFPDAA